MPALTQLSLDSDHFPDISHALAEPNGLLAVGGDLRPSRLLAGYRQGIFPWFAHESPILWWSPDPRCVIFPINCILHAAYLKACAIAATR